MTFDELQMDTAVLTRFLAKEPARVCAQEIDAVYAILNRRLIPPHMTVQEARQELQSRLALWQSALARHDKLHPLP
jgi:hypothetical protein